MTDEERKYRNPAPEVAKFSYEECPEIRVGDLELHRVYIVQGTKLAASFNYAGKTPSINPITLDAVVVHRFHGPRINYDVMLLGMPDGTFQTGDGEKVIVRKYSGADA